MLASVVRKRRIGAFGAVRVDDHSTANHLHVDSNGGN
jgi:hypothetical protein